MAVRRITLEHTIAHFAAWDTEWKRRAPLHKDDQHDVAIANNNDQNELAFEIAALDRPSSSCAGQ